MGVQLTLRRIWSFSITGIVLEWEGGINDARPISFVLAFSSPRGAGARLWVPVYMLLPRLDDRDDPRDHIKAIKQRRRNFYVRHFTRHFHHRQYP